MRDLIYTWQVPFFFVLSGYLWSAGRPVVTEVRNRWRTLGVPYAFWLGTIGALCVALQLYQGDFTWQFVVRLVAGGSYLGRPFSAFWFLSALFVACLLYRLLERSRWAIAGVATAGLVAAWTLPLALAAIPLGAGIAIPALSFMFAGVMLKRIRERILLPALVGACLIVIAGAIVALGWADPLDMKRGDFGTPVISVLVAVAISFGLILVADYFTPLLGRTASRWVVALATCGTMVILTHSAVLWLLASPPQGSFIDFTLAIAVPWVVALAISRTPLAPLMIGAPQRKVMIQPA